MHLAINIKLKINIKRIKILKKTFLCNKNKGQNDSLCKIDGVKVFVNDII